MMTTTMTTTMMTMAIMIMMMLTMLMMKIPCVSVPYDLRQQIAVDVDGVRVEPDRHFAVRHGG